MTAIKIDWETEVPRLVAEHFRSVGIMYEGRTELNECLIDFFNLELKLIDPVPRTVFVSNKFKTIRLPEKNKRALQTIADKIKSGQSVTYHQSKKTLDPLFNDLLLNDWVIYHFHLSDTKSKPGQKFYDRADYLLFAMFSKTQVFFIDVRKHKEDYVFAKQEFLQIVDDNWPHILKVHAHEDAAFLNNRYSDAEIAMLRDKGYMIGTTEINGKIVINPGIGITTSGHNSHVIQRAHWVIRYLHGAISEIEKDPEGMKQSLSKEAGFEISELDVEVQRLDKWPFFAVYEKNSKCYIEKNYEQVV